MSDPISGGEQAGRRAARNSGVSAAGEMVGKLATLVLLAILARQVGPSELGVLVFALAFLGVTLIPVGFGTDSYLLRQVARDRREGDPKRARRALDELFWSVVGLKLAVTLPALALSAVVLQLIGYPARGQLVIAVLAVSLLLDQFARSFQTLFLAYERSEFIALGLVVQRLLSLAIALAVLLGGGGLLEVAVGFGVASLVHLSLLLFLLRRLISLPPWGLGRPRWRSVSSASLPFAVQDIFTVLLFKLDAVLLAVLATDAAVGRYGAAYRLLEATLFVSYAVNNSVVAMYSYLTADSEPTVGEVYGRSVKLVLVLLVPVALVLGVLAEPIMRLVFGGELAQGGGALRLLAPVVVFVAFVTLSTSLINSRFGTGIILRLSAVMLAANVALNLVLVPRYVENGAALAMLVTEGVFAVLAFTIAVRLVGGLRWSVVLAGPLMAGLLMAVPLVALRATPLLAAATGTLAYVAALVGWERLRSPSDLDFVLGLLRRRLPSRTPA